MAGKKKAQIKIEQAKTPEVKNAAVAEAREVLDARKELTNRFFGSRLDKLKAIQANNTDQPDDGISPEEAIAAGIEVQPLPNDEPQVDPQNEPVTVQDDDPVITRNGVSKKLSEWQAEVDSLYSKAAQTVQRAEIEVKDLDEKELDSIADAVASGTKEQQKEALKKVIGQAGEVARREAEKNRVKNEAIRLMRTVIDENKDMSSVPLVYARVQQIEQQLGNKVFVANDPARDAEARLKEAYKVVRVEWEKISGEQQTNAEITATNARKQTAIQVQGTTTRTNKTGQTVQPSRNDVNRQAIADMKKFRDRQRSGVA